MRRSSVNSLDPATSVKDLKATVPDGGWGWVVCASCLVGWMAIGGICMSYGIILPSLKAHFRQNTVVISLVGSILIGICGVIGPIVASMANRFGLRVVYMIGSITTGISIIAATFTSNAYVFLILYGVIAGFGIGLIMLPVSVGCNYYFDKRRALATGISKTGVSIGGFVFPPLADILLETFDWKAVAYCFATISFISCVFGALIRPLELAVVRKEDEEKAGGGGSNVEGLKTEDKLTFGGSNVNGNLSCEDGSTRNQRRQSVTQMQGYLEQNTEGTTELVFHPKERKGSKIFLPPLAKSNTFYDGSIDNKYAEDNTLCHKNSQSDARRYSVVNTAVLYHNEQEAGIYKRILDFFDLNFWKDPAMLSFLASRFFGNFSMATFYMFLPIILIENQFSMSQASIMLSVIGVPNMFSRIIVGAIMDHPRVDCVLLNFIGFTLVSIILCVFAFSDNYTVLLVLAALLGINFAPYQVNTSIALGQMLPTEKVASGSGKCMCVMGIASIIGPVLTGYIFDNTKNHKIIIFMIAFGFFVSGLTCLITTCIHVRRKKNAIKLEF